MDDLESRFAGLFGKPPGAIGRAPGRVNLIGEHVDYNDGPVLPMALELGTRIAVGHAEGGGGLDAYSVQFDQRLQRAYDAPPAKDWLDYAIGCIEILRGHGVTLPPLNLMIDSTIPMGAGLSSSAAFEVALFKALRELMELSYSDETLARFGQQVENEFIGMHCGLMDQMVCSLSRPGSALFFDTQSGETRTVRLLPGYTFSVIHCGVGHRLTDGGYNQRRAECEAAAEALDIKSLRELSMDDLPRIEALGSPMAERACHVVTEIERVFAAEKALLAGDAVTLGHLMTESHASQRDYYNVSLPELDALVESALRHGALGARLTGGGFGGSVVSLVRERRVIPWRDKVLHDRPGAYWIADA